LVGTFPGKLCKKTACHFSKEFCANPKNVPTKRKKEIALCCFQKSFAYLKGFGAKRQITYKFNIISKKDVIKNSNEQRAGPSLNRNLSIHTTFSQYKAIFGFKKINTFFLLGFKLKSSLMINMLFGIKVSANLKDFRLAVYFALLCLSSPK
jgi:hypothetical protein